MNLLLDAHVALWAIADHPKLSPKARELIRSPRSTIWVSVVSLWEIAIKASLKRGDIPLDSQEAADYFRQAGYRFLHLQPEHVVAVQHLPHHHSDPFDRMLAAQAITAPMRLLTRDQSLLRYGEMIVRV